MTNPKDALEWLERKAERERNMTEEQWLKSCTTEQLAEFLDFLLCADSFCEVCDINETCKIGDRCKYGEEEHEKCFMEWLKQPHTNE